MEETYREGTLIKPYERLSQEQIDLIDKTSLEILGDPGVSCYNEEAVDLFTKSGATVEKGDGFWNLRVPEKMVRDAVENAPSRVKLGARKEENALLLDAKVPLIYFGSGSESNTWLDVEMERFKKVGGDLEIDIPQFKTSRGSVSLLCRAARISEQLEHLDFFIRPVNIQDEDITEENHDVNKFFASLNNITKHVQAGLTSLNQLDNVIKMAEIIAGGEANLRKNPIISFITCLFKSPLQMVEDTTQKSIEIVKRGMPLVISSSPQGGSTAPIKEAGMVAQINAEILCGITLTQLISEGAPVLYGSVPVRSRMDDLHDMYGAPETAQYNLDCVQMARYYDIPCYSTAGVADSKVPGIEATVEKLFSHLSVATSGAQYIHYAFGLLDRTNTFCPVQAVLDNEQIGSIKRYLRLPIVSQSDCKESLEQVRRVMASSTRLYARFVRKELHLGNVSQPYSFESRDMEDRVISNALKRLMELEERPPSRLPDETVDEIYDCIPAILSRIRDI
ncbi:MAG: trimethylamine methyltransferase family protein [Thermodesulfobacteriota bacterium]|nr:trimethylamine methyltransferase family protein [Thermodesulfobacteriota bacterium]